MIYFYAHVFILLLIEFLHRFILADNGHIRFDAIASWIGGCDFGGIAIICGLFALLWSRPLLQFRLMQLLFLIQHVLCHSNNLIPMVFQKGNALPQFVHQSPPGVLFLN
jgi:hypothetical protein